MMIRKIVLCLVALVAMLAPGVGATNFYVSASGSDSNAGTSASSPWLHVPGTADCSAVCASAEPQNTDEIVIDPDDVQFCYQFFDPAEPLTDCGFEWTALQSTESEVFHAVYVTASISSAGTITVLNAPWNSLLRIRIISLNIANGVAANAVTVSFSGTNQRTYNLAANQNASDSEWAGDAGAALSMTTTSAGPANITIRYVVEDSSNSYSF